MTWTAKYVGLPFADGGRGPDAVDCWGLVRLVYAECLGIDLPSYGEISARDFRRVSRAIDAGKEAWVKVAEPEEFDAVVMRTRTGRNGHVGIYATGGRVLHVERASATVLERISGPLMAPRIAGYWRHA